jgi:lipoyl-dependent peroxiredoxin subunit C
MARILGIGEKFPEWSMDACVSAEKGKEFKSFSSKDMAGKWNVLFYWPLDFTFICPTEIIEFNKELKNFQEKGCNVWGASADSKFVHAGWRREHADLRNVAYPMLADNKKDLADALGILNKDKIPLRATFIVDPEGTIRSVIANDLSVGRNVKEILRVVDAFQTGELCPVNWEKGQKTLGR